MGAAGSIKAESKVLGVISQGVDGAIDWVHKPAIEQAEDVLRSVAKRRRRPRARPLSTPRLASRSGPPGRSLAELVDAVRDEKGRDKAPYRRRDWRAWPYGHLPQPRKVAPGKKPTAGAKERIQAANMKANEGS